MRNCANISPNLRRPIVVYHFATAPFWISYIWGKFDLLFYQCIVDCLPVVLSCFLLTTSTLQPVPNCKQFPLACLAPVCLPSYLAYYLLSLPYSLSLTAQFPLACLAPVLPAVLSCSLPTTSTLQPVPNYRQFPLACLAPVSACRLILLLACHLCSLSLPAYISHLLALRLFCLPACRPSYLSKHSCSRRKFLNSPNLLA